MKMVFIGAVRFSERCLMKLIARKAGVLAVFTVPKEAANEISDYADLEIISREAKIPVYRCNDINDTQVLGQIKKIAPDVIFVFGFSQLLSEKLLKLPRLGCIGSHPTLLPLHRGRHPLVWTIIEGLSTSGLSFFYLDKGADSGDILWQKSIPVSTDEDAASLYEKICCVAEQAIDEFLPALENGTAKRIPQDDSKATYWPKRSEADGEIQWSKPAKELYALIRALGRPYVGAHTFIDGKKVTIWRAKPCAEANPVKAASGIVADTHAGVACVATGQGCLDVLEWEPKTLITEGMLMRSEEKRYPKITK